MATYNADGTTDFVPGESNARAVTAVWLTSLEPAAAALGDPPFTLHVHGSGFIPDAVIVWNGGDETTTVVSDTELTTEVDMSTATTAMPIPVEVRTADGVSNGLTFTLQAATVEAA